MKILGDVNGDSAFVDVELKRSDVAVLARQLEEAGFGAQAVLLRAMHERAVELERLSSAQKVLEAATETGKRIGRAETLDDVAVKCRQWVEDEEGNSATQWAFEHAAETFEYKAAEARKDITT